ncbi:MAG: PilZ domain-containing protein [Planctomycetes bacterium]|nr:PilZ domain-containing protein [Planctomycetota bacterium]
MQLEQGSSRVEFHRLNTDIPVRYKFLSKTIDLGTDQIYEGTTCRLSGGGCLLVGKVPSLNWIPALLMGKILVGVNVLLPQQEAPVKALCRVSWIEAISEGSDRLTFGIQFVDIPKEGQDLITKYLIKSQMTTH